MKLELVRWPVGSDEAAAENHSPPAATTAPGPVSANGAPQATPTRASKAKRRVSGVDPNRIDSNDVAAHEPMPHARSRRGPTATPAGAGQRSTLTPRPAPPIVRRGPAAGCASSGRSSFSANRSRSVVFGGAGASLPVLAGESSSAGASASNSSIVDRMRSMDAPSASMGRLRT